ncbi:MAG: hypothetical protein K2Z81_21765 [Cyanobacteria bacterium]|nr:hypothetical protein [Cyanobacteriota bacterium]
MRVKDDFFLSAQLVGVWLTIYKVVLSFRDLIATIDEARMRKRAIAENAADVFCLLNEINFSNPVSKRQWEYRLHELTGLTLRELAYEDDLLVLNSTRFGFDPLSFGHLKTEVHVKIG